MMLNSYVSVVLKITRQNLIKAFILKNESDNIHRIFVAWKTMRCSPSNSSLHGLSHRAESSLTSGNAVNSTAALRFPLSIRILIVLTLMLNAVHSSAVELEISPEFSTSGTFNLSWQGGENETYRLLQIDNNDQRQVIYQGADTARVMTGLPNGDYIYQVEGMSGSSEPRKVTVAHHSLVRAFSFFGIGLAVFLATVIVVVQGNKGR
ncbi:MAG: hypothetical protein ABW139_12105 [Candidatus Thiodiazotropha sp. DIVDIV]